MTPKRPAGSPPARTEQTPAALAEKPKLPPKKEHPVSADADAVVKSIRKEILAAGYTLAEYNVALEDHTDGRTGEVDVKGMREMLSQGMSDSNTGDPGKVESDEVQAAVEGATPQDAARFIIETGSEDQKIIATTVLAQLQRLEALGFAFELQVVHVGDSVPQALMGARGMHQWTPRKGDNKSKIWLNGSDVTGKVGMSRETVLHELVHMATARIVYLGNLASAKGTKTAEDVKDLYAVTNHIVRHFNKRVADFKAGKGELTEFEQRMFNRQNNALTNPDEVLGWGQTNPDAKAYAESIPYPAHKNTWTAFVEAIRKLLGVPARAATALSEILRVSESLMSDNVNELLEMHTVDGKTGIQSQINSGINTGKGTGVSPALHYKMAL